VTRVSEAPEGIDAVTDYLYRLLGVPDLIPGPRSSGVCEDCGREGQRLSYNGRRDLCSRCFRRRRDAAVRTVEPT